ncbi:ADP-ribose pyrophosphatase [Nonlabens dokdonensis]|jgi:ADP-ribose pyrophosphatase|uniref:GDP-mannose pyrophosphatase n=2 Tax=Nonlabens dokdonensis TaxID=328515 RepID=L7W919_NONDD|nr:NUDIX hydrolase [Nonlabens dokdonensis]AGC78220.1 putative ADP-ribose pyrophosphatase protein [Nonlabens dokdonensis DSW-6]PZX37889.1 ADP-ribose pyrophosphatase [Nonlabens dokdonensis]
MKHKINKEELVFNDFLKIYKAEVTHDSFNSENSITSTRLALDRGNAIAVLLYEKDTDSFLFIKQYRYPSSRHGHSWMIEIPAGAIDEKETAHEAAIREVKEEIGYQVSELEFIVEYFPSPGMLSEQISIFYGEVTTKQKTSKGGGSISEKEDIQLIKIPKSEIKEKLQNNYFHNSISIISLQWYLLNS